MMIKLRMSRDECTILREMFVGCIPDYLQSKISVEELSYDILSSISSVYQILENALELEEI